MTPGQQSKPKEAEKKMPVGGERRENSCWSGEKRDSPTQNDTKLKINHETRKAKSEKQEGRMTVPVTTTCETRKAKEKEAE